MMDKQTERRRHDAGKLKKDKDRPDAKAPVPSKEAAPEEETTPESRLTSRQVTAGLAMLAALLLVFLLGMRLIDGKAGKLTEPAPATPASVAEPQDKTGKIDLNTATADALKSLPGIGDAKAEAIIEYRSEYGPFTSIEEIKNVKGIGDGLFDAIKADICV